MRWFVLLWNNSSDANNIDCILYGLKSDDFNEQEETWEVVITVFYFKIVITNRSKKMHRYPLLCR